MNASEEMHYIDSFKKIDAVLSRARAIREAVGMNMEFAIDFHGRIHKSMAKALAKELEPYHPMFIEEPVLSENIEALRDIANATSTPIATGERMFSRWDFKKILTEGYVDIIQPDLSHAAVSVNAGKLRPWQRRSTLLSRRIARSARCARRLRAAGHVHAKRLHSGAEHGHPL